MHDGIFHDMIEDFIEILMDDFSVFGSSFDTCLINLSKVLERCEESNLVLNWENIIFMVKREMYWAKKFLTMGLRLIRQRLRSLKNCCHQPMLRGYVVF